MKLSYIKFCFSEVLSLYETLSLNTFVPCIMKQLFLVAAQKRVIQSADTHNLAQLS